MSCVEFLIDPNKISLKTIDFELCGEKYSPKKASQIRLEIRKHLNAENHQPLVLRVDEAWFIKFKDFNGFRDVTVTPISLAVELGNVLKCDIPSWCNDWLITKYNLLYLARHSNKINFDLAADLKLLELTVPNLLNSVMYDQALHCIWSHTESIAPFFQSEIICNFLLSILNNEVSSNIHPLIFSILKNENSKIQLLDFFNQIFYEKIRKLNLKFDFEITVPPRQFDKKILENLEVSTFWWGDIKKEPFLSKVTTLIIDNINKGILKPEELSEVIFFYSKEQFDIIQIAIVNSPFIANLKLLAKLQTITSPRPNDLLELINQHVELPEPGPFDSNWKAKEVNDWACDYVKYAKSLFNRDAEPNSELTNSFEEWVINEPTRVRNPPFGWREVSAHVKALLEREKLVVLIIVDALGSIVSNELLDTLTNDLGNSVSVDVSHLFAPIPTLTEIGKIAVTTGNVKYQLSNNYESAIYSSYESFLPNLNDLQIIKSWNGDKFYIKEGTRLLVYFENQLDEMLHECINYSDLSKQLEIVCKKVTKFVSYIFDENNIFRDNTEVVISADHGLSKIVKISNELDYKSIGKVGDRHIKEANRESQINGFWNINPEGADDNEYFLVKKGRSRLVNGPRPFVHGGILPEEVLIPFIKIKANSVNASDTNNVYLHLEGSAELTAIGWLIELQLEVNKVDVEYATLEAMPPFKSHKQKLFNIPSKSKTKHILSISTEIQQSGITNIVMKGVYRYADGSHEEILHTFEINLPEHNIVIDKDSLDFDDMFN